MRPKTSTVTRLDYCQYLLVSQINYTLTNFAEHTEKFSHDALNCYLAGEKLGPKLTWENVQNQVMQRPKVSWFMMIPSPHKPKAPCSAIVPSSRQCVRGG